MASTSAGQGGDQSDQLKNDPSSVQLVADVCSQFAEPSGLGLISMKKLKIVMRALGLEPRQAEVNEIAKKLLKNSEARQKNPDSFAPQELAVLLSERLREKEEGGGTDEIRSVFGLFDLEEKGYISINDLRRVANELGEQLGEEELAEMVNVAETGAKRGRVSEADFRAIMKKISLY